MSEGAEEKPATRFYCVCGHCNHHDSTPGVEINFHENAIYYKCSSCRKMNKMMIKALVPQPFPKGRTGLR
jgi:hypothetical protein